MPDELTSSEAATLLGLSLPALDKLLDSGALPSRREGDDRFVPSSAVLAFLERRERMAAARDAFAEAAKQHPDLFAGDDPSTAWDDFADEVVADDKDRTAYWWNMQNIEDGEL